MQELDSVILVDKPAGISSFGVVARVRRRLSVAAGHKVKVGHTGTLDPFATGLMILLSGKFTRRASEFSKLDKVYEATIRLGANSTTGDPEGEITDKVVDKIPKLAEVQKATEKFKGKITQQPPIYSAIKIDGQRAYKLARQGKNIDMPLRQITIYALDIISYDYPYLKIRTHVSSGTYIRTLAADIGATLGVGAYTTELRRTVVGDYDVENAEHIDI